MYQKEVFRIDYPTGHMNLNVGLFFGTATQKGIKKVLGLCRRYCTDSRRSELIDMLQRELEQHQNVLNHLDKIESERIDLLEEFGAGYDLREKTPIEHGIQTRIAKMSAVMRDLDANERWKG